MGCRLSFATLPGNRFEKRFIRMVAVDTNLLVYAHREDATWHKEAGANLLELANGNERWAIPWPCVHEFLAIVPTLASTSRQPPPRLRARPSAYGWVRRSLCLSEKVRVISTGSKNLPSPQG